MHLRVILKVKETSMHRTLEINCDVVGPVRLAAKLSLDNEGKINYSSRECLCGREHYGFVISTERQPIHDHR